PNDDNENSAGESPSATEYPGRAPCKDPKSIAYNAKEISRPCLFLNFLPGVHCHNCRRLAQSKSSAYTWRARNCGGAATAACRPLPYRRKIKPSTKPIPSAVKTAFVGFSRTYCVLSSLKLRTTLSESSHT